MKAKYIGIDGVVRYKKGRVYDLIENPKDRVRLGNVYKIIARKRGGGVNVYSSKKMFDRDWDIIKE